MSKKTKVWLTVAGCLVIAGLIVFTFAMSAYGWDFSKLSTTKYETRTYTPDGTFSKIHIYTEDADITFIPSENNICTVVCYEQENARHIVDVANDSLYVRVQNEKKWYEYIGINFSSPKITVSLPQSQYDALFINSSTGDVNIPKHFQFDILDISVDTGDVINNASVSETIKIKTDTGDIRMEDVSADTVNLTVSTGETYLTNIRCRKLTSSGDTGDIILKNVIATEQFSIDRSTGNVKFDSCDALDIFVQTDTGNVTGSLLSEKVFVTKTSTGKVKVPSSASGGKCSIVTSTGDIRLEVKKP